MHLALPGGGERDLDGLYGPMGDGDAYVVAVDLPPEVTVSEQLRITCEHGGAQLAVSKVRAGNQTLSLAQ